MSQPDITDEMLHAFVDGQLGEADQQRVEAYLNANPERMAEVADWNAQNDTIRALFPASDTDIPMPAPITANTTRAPWRAIAASVVFLGLGVVLGWYGRGAPTGPNDIVVAGLVQEAVAAHAVFSADPNRPVEIRANEEDLLVSWLSKRIGKTLSAPDLRANGFELVGGRLLSVSDGPAAQFMYENTDGLRITLFATRGDGTLMAEFSYERDGDTGSFTWADENLRYAIVGDLPREELNALAIRVYQSFS